MAKTDQHATRTCRWLWQTGRESQAMADKRTRMFKPPSADDTEVSAVVRRLVEVYHPERIYLFGSAARGDAGPDSDYDLMVIVPDSTSTSDRDSGRAYKAIWRLGVASDVLVWTREQFESRLHLKASLPSTTAREGRLLNAI